MDYKNAFIKVAAHNSSKRKGWPHSYDVLLRTIKSLGQKTDDLNSIEQALRQAFKKFLIDSQFFLAAKNFEALLEEKSGENFFRNDGTVAWFHEFIPIMMVLSAARKSSRDYGIENRDLEAYGGLETAIIIHLRHDSIEDHIEKEDLRRQQCEMLEEIRAEGRESYVCKALSKVAQIVESIDTMSQKKLYDANGQPVMAGGKHIKENVVDYIARLVYSETANPIVFILKQADIIHNFATMLGAEKFSAERRAKRHNEKENMYGPRQCFYDHALVTWPRFKKVIDMFDANMGDIIYKHFRYLETVDLFYKDAPEAFRREPNDYPVAPRFTEKALQLDLPEIIHPLHIFMKRLQNSVDPSADPEKIQRFQNLMEKVIKPSLEPFRDHFPYIFTKQPVAKPVPPAIAFN